MQFLAIAYDIANDRRRRTIATVLEGYGWRVQDSLFHCELALDERTALIRQLSDAIDPNADTIRIYPLCQKDRADVRAYGRKPPPPPMEDGFRIV